MIDFCAVFLGLCFFSAFLGARTLKEKSRQPFKTAQKTLL